MKQMNTVFRALTEYRKRINGNRDCTAFRDNISKAKSDTDNIELRQTICIVEEDWVLAIEEGLVHIDKCIKEDRQFIRSEGEVVPIEKAKRVSRDSIEHLSRHSNLITREQDVEKDLIPDQIYIVKRDSDYSVYENRFLYTLLCNLSEFVTMRYEKIIELSGIYRGEMNLNRKIDTRGRKINFELKFSEERRDDPIIKDRNPSKDVIDRVSTILRAIQVFLQTPLMQMVSKTAKLKPPITKTNVLKMDKNFKGAVVLYDFLFSYDKLGYEIKTETTKITAFPGEMGEEIAETTALASFLTYEYSLGLKSILKQNYEDEKAREQKEEELKHIEQIKSLKRRIIESGESPEEYMLSLEKRNRLLENEVQQIPVLTQEIADLNQKALELNANIDALNGVIQEKEQEIETVKQECEDRVSELEKQNAENIEQIKDRNTLMLEQLHERHAEEINQVGERWRSQLSSAEEQLKEIRENTNKKIEDARLGFVEENKAYEEKCRNAVTEKNRIQSEYNSLRDENRLTTAELYATKQRFNLLTGNENFTSEAAFTELEKQYEAYTKFFNKQWKKAKKEIRKNVIKERFEEEKNKEIQKKVDKRNSKLLKKEELNNQKANQNNNQNGNYQDFSNQNNNPNGNYQDFSNENNSQNGNYQDFGNTNNQNGNYQDYNQGFGGNDNDSTNGQNGSNN